MPTAGTRASPRPLPEPPRASRRGLPTAETRVSPRPLPEPPCASRLGLPTAETRGRGPSPATARDPIPPPGSGPPPHRHAARTAGAAAVYLSDEILEQRTASRPDTALHAPTTHPDVSPADRLGVTVFFAVSARWMSCVSNAPGSFTRATGSRALERTTTHAVAHSAHCRPGAPLAMRWRVATGDARRRESTGRARPLLRAGDTGVLPGGPEATPMALVATAHPAIMPAWI